MLPEEESREVSTGFRFIEGTQSIFDISLGGAGFPVFKKNLVYIFN